MARKLRVVHVINSFEFGGAEAMLCNLVLRTDASQFETHVCALIDDLRTATPLLDAGMRIETMGMRPGVPDPRGVFRLARHLAAIKPDVVQTWMDHSNLIGSLGARLGSPGAAQVWGVHHSDHVPGKTKRSTLMTVGACARLSYALPRRIVCCAEHGVKLYARAGFDGGKLTFIPNGFDTERFHPSGVTRAAVRAELGIAAGTPVVGLVARYDPLKDHATFLRAAARLRRDVRFVTCGARVDEGNAELIALIESLGLRGRVHLLGARRDVPRIYAALDVLASSSISEAFPLVVGEAMACGVPCAVTDVGDSAAIVGHTGRVVPPSDPLALARAMGELLAMPAEQRRLNAMAARRRVVENFDLNAVTRRYEAMYAELAGVATPVKRTVEERRTISFPRLAVEAAQAMAG